MKIKQLPLGPIGTNCYIIYKENTALIVDPGDSPNQIIQFLEKEKLRPIAILLTHTHFDHIGAVDPIREAFNIPVFVHALEEDWLEDPSLNGSQFFALPAPITAKKAEKTLEEGTLSIGDFEMEVRHTPGHSPGSCSFIFHHEGFVIAGDTLFQGGIGRTDLPGGDFAQLYASIHHKLLSLPESLIVYPGHGPKTTIDEEKKFNPFLK